MRGESYVYCLAVLAAIGTSCAGEGNRGPRRFLSLGTAGTGGIYYPLGGALASRLSLADEARQYTAEVTGGSLENINRIANGEMDLGFSLATTMVQAYEGGPDHDVPMSQLRIVAPLYPNLTHVLVADGSPIRSLSDVTGRRVSVGAPGSGTEQVARQILDAHGIGYDDIDVRYLSFRESADAMRDGAIDAAIISVGYPAAAVLEVMTAGVADLIPIDEEHQRILTDRYPYYSRSAIPQDAYRGLNDSVSTIAVMNWIVAYDNLDSSVARLVLETLAEQRSALEQVHGIAAQIDLNVLDGTPPIPLHPATVEWWRSQAKER